MSKLDFILKYVPGTKMGKANRLSKRPDWKVGIEKNDENQTLIKEQWIYRLAKVVIEESKVDIIEKIKIARSKDKEVVKVVEEIVICQRTRSWGWK